ncbi:MAG: MTAP family purine nucleoside phosphorylase [Sedimentisphaerales bacterium]|nr:MTAP family purine nucleoside phosphorylase [Sedimentisphaerales bacterium]
MANIIGLIGGSGLGDALAEQLEDVKRIKVDTPFGSPSGEILTGTFVGKEVAFINRHGEGHKFNPSTVPYAANIFALKKLGVNTVIASGAVGSLEKKIKPKDLAIVGQVIDKTFKRQNTFFDDIGAVHCEFSYPYCQRLGKVFLSAAEAVNSTVHPDVSYVCMEGPQFSTRAESLMHQKWGGQLIGMTGMPEAKLAREAQMCFVLVTLISDYDCWREPSEKKDAQTLLQEIIGNLNEATVNAIELIKEVLKSGQAICDDDCPCRKSLELAVWTRSEQISDEHKGIFEILKQ